MTYKKNKGIVKKPASTLQTKRRTCKKVAYFCSMCNGIERDPRVKTDHEAQEQEPSTVKGKRAISNCQVGYWPEDINNGEGSSDMMNDIFLMDQVIDSTDGEKSDSESYNLIPLPQPENLQFLVAQLRKGFYNEKMSSFYPGKNLSDSSDDDENENENNDMKSDKTDETETEEESEEESEEENLIRFDAPDLDDTPETNARNVDEDLLEIVLWVFHYQQKYRHSDTSIHTLIKYIQRLLTRIDKKKYCGLPTSIDVAKKMAGISDYTTRFAVCESCCKLYNPKDISTKKARQTPNILRCTHIEFPNHVNISRRVSCDTILSKKVRVHDGIIRKPISIYPVINLKQQFLKLFQQSGFEKACKR